MSGLEVIIAISLLISVCFAGILAIADNEHE